jgi:hypothetical protein
MIEWSVLIGIAGLVGSGFAAVLSGRLASAFTPLRYWLCSLAALFPAWLIALFGLLGHWTSKGPDAPMPPTVILSSSIALFGVIITDWLVR